MDRLVNLSISDLSFLITVKVRQIFVEPECPMNRYSGNFF